jgi:Cell Wall Hydrolase
MPPVRWDRIHTEPIISVIHASGPGISDPCVSLSGYRLQGGVALALMLAICGLLLWELPAAQSAGPKSLPLSRRAARAVPRPPLPVPPPVGFVRITPETARDLNARVPFSRTRNTPARPFHAVQVGDDLARATDCLAAAAYYEAGDDPVGQKAVVQVVLNRVRHPAFPRSICGVVFQGSERATGCQFTFTCDGALERRTPSPAAWSRARDIALAALHGAVYRPVGLATHYHTDWVVPYWSGTLDKIASVGTHLFFRWRGFWGTRAAFDAPFVASEPMVARLARLSPASAPVTSDAPYIAVSLDGLDAEPAMPDVSTVDMKPLPDNPSVFLLHLPPAQQALFPQLAARACGRLRNCRFLVWTDPRSVASALPLSDRQWDSMAFSYVRDLNAGYERTNWGCRSTPAPTGCGATFTAH